MQDNQNTLSAPVAQANNIDDKAHAFVPLAVFCEKTGFTAQTARAWVRRRWLVGATKGANGRWFIPKTELERIGKDGAR